MAEILQVQVGQCGNQLGTQFWEAITKEHGIDARGVFVGERDSQLERASAFYSEGMGQRYLPRVLLVDLDSGATDSARASAVGRLFKQENYISGLGGAGNNWAKGHYTQGAQIVDNITDMARLEVEACDRFQGFQIVHSISGGTGSGLGTLLISKFREQYPDRMIHMASVLSNPGTTDSLASPYNETLSLHQMIENADSCVLVDNRTLYRILFRMKKHPSYADLNTVVAQAISSITCSWRFRCNLNEDMRRTACNLIPYPRAHFLMASYAPLGLPQEDEQFRTLNCSELVGRIFQPVYTLCDTELNRGKCIAGAVISRGRQARSQVTQEVMRQAMNKGGVAEWPAAPDSTKLCICEEPPAYRRNSASFLCNSTAVRDVLQLRMEQFHAMFRRKAFLHWYLGEGMDQMEFTEAISNLTDLSDEYQQFEQDT